MDARTRDGLVTDFEPFVAGLRLPDPDDRHVLAAAIKGRADLIVTVDLRHLPAAQRARWGLEALHPDDFSIHPFHLNQPVFLQAVRTVRLRPRNPPTSVEDYLGTLRI